MNSFDNRTSDYVCFDCGRLFLKKDDNSHNVVTAFDGQCGLCNQVKAVTHMRAFNWLHPVVYMMPEEIVKEKVDEGLWQRAGGECICLVCKQEYQRHPNFKGQFYWLTQLCDGFLVKL